jgi:hypothetical protein
MTLLYPNPSDDQNLAEEARSLAAGLDSLTKLRQELDSFAMASFVDTKPYQPSETIFLRDTPNAFRIIVRERVIKVSGANFSAAEVVVEPADREVQHTAIDLGGYAVNHPFNRRLFSPFCNIGEGHRFVFLNQLGAGGSSHATANLSAFNTLGKPALGKLPMSQKIATRQARELFENYEGSFSLNGMSQGGKNVLEMLTIPAPIGLTSTELERVTEVNLDDPLTNGRYPFSIGKDTAQLALTAITEGYPYGLIGRSGQISPEALEKLMLPNARLSSQQLQEIHQSLFTAPGSLPALVLNSRPDPILKLSPEDDRLEALQQIKFTYYTRPDGHTVPYAKTAEQIARHRALGLDISEYALNDPEHSDLHILDATLNSFRQTNNYFGSIT